MDETKTTTEDDAVKDDAVKIELSTERAIALWAIGCLLILLPVGLAAVRVLGGY